MNLKYKTLLSILLFFVFNNLLSQEYSDIEIGLNVQKVREKLLLKELSETEIINEINALRVYYTNEYNSYINNQNNSNSINSYSSRNTPNSTLAVPMSEKQVLIDLYNSTQGQNWTNTINNQGIWLVNDPLSEVTSWNPSSGTGWYGVVVEDGHIVSINLMQNNLNGDLIDLTNLPNLRYLNLRNNDLTSSFQSVPYWLTNKISLKYLDITNCNFSGEFPNFSSLINLESLLIFDNYNPETIPSWLNNLTNLKNLSIRNCNLYGSLTNVFLLSNLEFLDFSFNDLSGNIPTTINNLSNLKSLSLSSNLLSGSIPLEIMNLTNLIYIGLDFNNFSGNIPYQINQLNNLSSLVIYVNNFSGNIPNEINQLNNLYFVGLSHNKFNGEIPIINFTNNSPTNQTNFFVNNNHFAFKDIESTFVNYNNNLTYFRYFDQAKTDTVISETVNAGSSYTMTMHTNGNFSSVEEYQWYKGVYPSGTSIPGATQRELTINNVSLSDEGTYYCVSTHPTITITSDTFKNLVLVREPINLTVVNCQPLTGEIQPRENYDCGPSYTTAYNFSNYNPNDQYFWTFLDPNGNVITSSTLSGTNPVTFNQIGVNNINLVITSSDGCIHNFSYQVEIVECEPEPICETHLSFNFATPNGLLNNDIRLKLGTGIVNFINQNLNSQLYITSIDDFSNGGVRYRPAQQTFTTPWDQPFINSSDEIKANSNLSIQDTNYSNTIINEWNGILNNVTIDKKINITFVLASQDNFSNISDVQLAYGNLINSNKTDKVFFVFFENGTFRDISTNTNLSPENYINAIIGSSAINFDSTGSVLDSNYKLFTVSEYANVNFDQLIQQFIQDAYDDILDVACNEPCSPIMGQIIPTIESAFCVGQKIDFNFSTTENIVSYSWSAVDNSTGNILNTYTFGNTFTTLFPASGSYTINLEVVDNDGCSSLFTYNLNAINCIQNSCTENNPNSQVVKQYFINLINHLITLSSVPNGYTCPELTLLAPYVQPDDPVAIYNYFNDGAQIKFSFSDHGSSFDVWIVYSQSTVLDVDLSNYVSYDQVTSLDSKVITLNGITKGSVKHIEFCPDELHCKKHIAIVVDESGSIDESEARKIKSQLKSFIEQQTVDNETLGTNVHVSLIGLSDSDNPIRTDFDNLINNKLTNLNKSLYIDWINNYRSDRNGAIGVSPNSDYWNSGLIEAYSSGAELVILITDGCQTANANQLQQTVRNFNNNNGGSSINAPHLYVIGLDNGFYVDSDTPLTNRASSEDPNMNPSLERNSGVNSRVTSYLRTSLKYLMEYPANDFPVNDKYNFIYRPLDGSANPPLQMVDYFGIDDFNFFYDEPNYLYNGSVGAGISCGDEIPLEKCNNCLNFKPIPGKEYVISAWVKEELKIQVKDYTSAELHVNFKNVNDDYIVGSEIICNTSGDIIDEWQRIFKKFSVPNDAVYIEIALVNNSGSVPVYFDDIRIHPVDGSMKSFVYDPETFRLMSELDENNFSTYYEYDNEGGLIRVKKETSRGVKTIQETRSGNVIKVE